MASEVRRVLGTWETGRSGPLVVLVGGIHGNEPAGVRAVRRVLAVCEDRGVPLRGRLLGVAGNIGALRAGRRYLQSDLNRAWTEERIAALRARAPEEDSGEERERREILELLEAAIAERPWERVVLIDLHSTSAAGAPFSIMADTLQNRTVAFALPIPVILGLEERVEGTLLSHFGDLGHVAVCVEGGQNDDPSTVEHHEAAAWLSLVAAGALTPGGVPDFARHRAVLEATAENLSPVVEIRYRFPVPSETPFEMAPGYSNFDRIERGESLARVGEEGAEVHAPADGLLLMPRYQGQGEDGFFLGREVRPFWLRLSEGLRRGRLDWVLSALPGVRRDPERPGSLLVNPRVARYLAIQLFHLFGYRWSRWRSGRLVFVRRPDRHDRGSHRGR